MSDSYYPSVVSKAALIVVDLQEDFLPPNGSLAVEGGRDIIPLVNELVNEYEWATIIATKDWHPKGHCSFASSHVGLKPFDTIKLSSPSAKDRVMDHTVWPDHCVQESFGSQFPPEFNATRVESVVKKGHVVDREFYSAFEDVWGEHFTELDDLLKAKGVEEVYTVGLAMDYCVFHTASDAAKRGYRTYVIREATRSVMSNNDSETINRYAANNVNVISSQSEELVAKLK